MIFLLKQTNLSSSVGKLSHPGKIGFWSTIAKLNISSELESEFLAVFLGFSEAVFNVSFTICFSVFTSVFRVVVFDFSSSSFQH